jgi:hypothetical protein
MEFPIKEEIFSVTFWQGISWVLITCMAPLVALIFELKFRWRLTFDKTEASVRTISVDTEVTKHLVENNQSEVKEVSDDLKLLTGKVDNIITNQQTILSKVSEIEADVSTLKKSIFLGDVHSPHQTMSRRRTDIDGDADKVRDILTELRRMTDGG